MTLANIFVPWILGMVIYPLGYSVHQVFLGNPGGTSR